ncbi:hypothetical protein [Fusibacter sp. 3D3]|uniref:hypothetical protein n=1 Tax=Fusibacter sp. 3D3 TaxID=1048380 RepID=UPI000853C68A|nr:hypothetical protein [Fusibacter sp. 3D3]GAU79811.1 hypothetical protein F3D3_4476 [Fusibacter sp. 3D3]
MHKRYLSFALILAIIASSLSFATGEVIYYSMPVYTQLEDEWCWNAVAQMVADSRFNVTKSQYDVADIDYKKSTGYSYTSSQSFIVGKLRTSNNPIALGMEFSNGAEHALAVHAYDDRNYNQRIFYVDPGPGQATNEYFSWDELQYTGLYVIGTSYYLDGEW